MNSKINFLLKLVFKKNIIILMVPIDILGLLCAFLTGILYIPQLVHMIKRKSTQDVSYLFLILTFS